MCWYEEIFEYKNENLFNTLKLLFDYDIIVDLNELDSILNETKFFELTYKDYKQTVEKVIQDKIQERKKKILQPIIKKATNLPNELTNYIMDFVY